ncbi:MAG: hypothetical protein MUP90_14895, partial [Gammaproteobacteria bacterium]|nr:hypothetical protein [Gammaproteobacteria bacterium]
KFGDNQHLPRIRNAWVGGSNPLSGTTLCFLFLRLSGRLALIHRGCQAGADLAWASGSHADHASAQALSRAV